MILADLYENTIPLADYVSSHDCQACGFRDRAQFLEKLRSGQLRPDMCRMSKERFWALSWAARPRDLLPQIEVLQLPSPGPTGLFPLNEPDLSSPVLVSGNSELTIEVLSAVLSTTTSPFWYLVVDTHGHTVDMALVYEVLTAERIARALLDEAISRKAREATVYLPGLAAPLTEKLTRSIDLPVKPGPVCAAALPLFFGKDRWKIAEHVP